MDPKRATLEEVIARVQRRWGPGALRPGRQLVRAPRLPPLESGFGALDRLLGGGLARGAVVELVGRPTSGKRTLALHALAGAQRRAEPVVYLDLERSFDPLYAQRCGLDLAALLLVRPAEPPLALEIAQELIGLGAGAMVLDSLAPLVAAPGGAHGLAAALRRLVSRLEESPCVLIVLSPFDPARIPPGAAPLRHHARQRLALRRQGWLHEARDVTGYRVEARLLDGSGRGVTLELWSGP